MGDTLELRVRTIYTLAGFDPAVPPGPEAIIHRLFGAGTIELAPDGPSRSSEAWLYFRESWRVRLPASLAPEVACAAMGRAIARWYMLTRMKEITSVSVVELGAALLLPAPAVAICIGLLGYSHTELAFRFCVSEELAIRRIMSLQPTARSDLREVGSVARAPK